MKKPLLLVILSCLTIVIDFAAAAVAYRLLPDPSQLLNGTQLERTNSDGKRFKFLAGPKNKKYLSIREMPSYLESAIITLEDSRFYQHRGFDFEEVLNAIITSFQKGKRLRGASTLSQQLVKNLYLSPKRTFQRKVLEALITVKLELTVPKRKIIELYLNSIDWGRGLFGIQEASQFYFKKPPSLLNLRESVFLASIIPNPARFGRVDEDQVPKLFVRKQMMKALQALYKSGVITLNEFEQAVAVPPPPNLIPEPHDLELTDEYEE